MDKKRYIIYSIYRIRIIFNNNFMNKFTYFLIVIVALFAVGSASIFIKTAVSPRQLPASVGQVTTVRESAQNTNLPSQVVLLGTAQNISWKPENFPTPFVKLSVIKKVSSNPTTYELVRIISEKTANDGSATWIPTNSDLGSNIFVEVGCVDATESCSPSISMTSIAVNYSGSHLNTAAAYQSIESSQNK